MANPMISIIIPIYNTEKYIEQCLNSLIEQSYQNFEIICVDDGSTDNSLRILKDYENKYEQIKVLSQKNLYAGVARNTGMKIATGKYLLFLDADDFSRNDMLQCIVKAAESEQTEILVFDEYLYDNISQKIIRTSWRPLKKDFFGEGVKSCVEIADTIFEFTNPGPCNKLFLREFIIKNNLWFQPIQRTNDLYFVYTSLSYAERIGILDEKFLYIRSNNCDSLQGSGSATPTIFAQAIYALRENLESRGVFSLFQKSFENMTLSISLYNLNNMKQKWAYQQVYCLLREELFPMLNFGEKVIEPQIVQVISLRKKVIIYGAGAVATAIIRLLIDQYRCAKEDITIVVSDSRNNVQEIWGVKVKEFQMMSKSENSDLVIIAVSDKKVQDEIEMNVKKAGFDAVVKVGFREMADLIRG